MTKLFNPVSCIAFIVFLVFPQAAASPATLSEILSPQPRFNHLTMDGEIEFYNRDNLWEYIDGAAPGYISFGFEEVATFVLLTQNQELDFTVDIYDMADTLNAFGIFSIETSIEGRNKKFGSGSFSSANVVYFWQNHFYVKIMASEDTDQSKTFLRAIAVKISDLLPAGGSLPAVYSLLPVQNRVRNSEKYFTRDVLGQNYFTRGFTAHYSGGNSEYDIYLICSGEIMSARENFKKYQNYVTETGEVVKTGFLDDSSSFWGKDDYYGSIGGFRKNADIVVVVGKVSSKKAGEIFRKIRKLLPDGKIE